MSFLVAGLGNIGVEYAQTRHNVGFMVLDAWVKASGTAFSTLRYGSLAEVRVCGKHIYLLKPSTYMNLSGKAVNYWLKEEKIPLERLLVVLDDIALPLGTIRMRKQGSDGGHNGLRSIQETLQTNEYTRLRVGIGNHFGDGQQSDYVLGEWEKEELIELPFVVDKCIEAIKAFVVMGPDLAMNSCNVVTKNNE
ncbi:MAG: aminoacyl-tRNA hydrolase [Prevotellaceae bacterium]|jgi:PTH1 family peptidyl-tRNA hydrolase|nr:aminoacyl-tRNA hydrolase [Prevotellaceae bacterium]